MTNSGLNQIELAARWTKVEELCLGFSRTVLQWRFLSRSLRLSLEMSTSPSQPARSAVWWSSLMNWWCLDWSPCSRSFGTIIRADYPNCFIFLSFYDHLISALLISNQVDVNQSRDPDGLRCFYYLVQVWKHKLTWEVFFWQLNPSLGPEMPGVFSHWPPFQDQAHLNTKSMFDEAWNEQGLCAVLKIKTHLFNVLHSTTRMIRNNIRSFAVLCALCM